MSEEINKEKSEEEIAEIRVALEESLLALKILAFELLFYESEVSKGAVMAAIMKNQLLLAEFIS